MAGGRDRVGSVGAWAAAGGAGGGIWLRVAARSVEVSPGLAVSVSGRTMRALGLLGAGLGGGTVTGGGVPSADRAVASNRGGAGGSWAVPSEEIGGAARGGGKSPLAGHLRLRAL
ncbi:hypothetical protein EDB85DRAFT_1898321 [Lactarius pseudohatsudake]|nr:hypothetical protein EDB85DRAFT_1898321 [Lactarius pseudohatsudake]